MLVLEQFLPKEKSVTVSSVPLFKYRGADLDCRPQGNESCIGCITSSSAFVANMRSWNLQADTLHTCNETGQTCFAAGQFRTMGGSLKHWQTTKSTIGTLFPDTGWNDLSI